MANVRNLPDIAAARPLTAQNQSNSKARCGDVLIPWSPDLVVSCECCIEVVDSLPPLLRTHVGPWLPRLLGLLPNPDRVSLHVQRQPVPTAI